MWILLFTDDFPPLPSFIFHKKINSKPKVNGYAHEAIPALLQQPDGMAETQTTTHQRSVPTPVLTDTTPPYLNNDSIIEGLLKLTWRSVE
jgi:hypothetical protein